MKKLLLKKLLLLCLFAAPVFAQQPATSWATFTEVDHCGGEPSFYNSTVLIESTIGLCNLKASGSSPAGINVSSIVQTNTSVVVTLSAAPTGMVSGQDGMYITGSSNCTQINAVYFQPTLSGSVITGTLTNGNVSCTDSGSAAVRIRFAKQDSTSSSLGTVRWELATLTKTTNNGNYLDWTTTPPTKAVISMGFKTTNSINVNCNVGNPGADNGIGSGFLAFDVQDNVSNNCFSGANYGISPEQGTRYGTWFFNGSGGAPTATTMANATYVVQAVAENQSAVNFGAVLDPHTWSNGGSAYIIVAERNNSNNHPVSTVMTGITQGSTTTYTGGAGFGTPFGTVGQWINSVGALVVSGGTGNCYKTPQQIISNSSTTVVTSLNSTGCGSWVSGGNLTQSWNSWMMDYVKINPGTPGSVAPTVTSTGHYQQSWSSANQQNGCEQEYKSSGYIILPGTAYPRILVNATPVSNSYASVLYNAANYPTPATACDTAGTNGFFYWGVFYWDLSSGATGALLTGSNFTQLLPLPSATVVTPLGSIRAYHEFPIPSRDGRKLIFNSSITTQSYTIDKCNYNLAGCQPNFNAEQDFAHLWIDPSTGTNATDTMSVIGNITARSNIQVPGSAAGQNLLPGPTAALSGIAGGTYGGCSHGAWDEATQVYFCLNQAAAIDSVNQPYNRTMVSATNNTGSTLNSTFGIL